MLVHGGFYNGVQPQQDYWSEIKCDGQYTYSCQTITVCGSRKPVRGIGKSWGNASLHVCH